MRVCKIKTETRIPSFDDYQYLIRKYGTRNDYPQKCMEIMAASGTAMACWRLFVKFIKGKGFEKVNGKTQLSKGFTLNNLKDKWAEETGRAYGRAAWVNRNALFQVTEIKFIPFEFCRLAIDKDRNLTGQIAVHPDWGQRRLYPRLLNKKDVKYIDPFDDDPEVIAQQVNNAGGWSKWLGQIYWFSAEGTEYPKAIYDPVISDMSTENSVSTIKNRSAKNGFLPAGMLVTKGKAPANNSDGDTGTDTEAGEAINQLQGDENSFNILEVEVEYDEEIPTFVEFPIKNIDKLFDVTEKTIQQNIGNAFNQPPILRGLQTIRSTQLPTSIEIKDAYDYYNSITEDERTSLAESIEIVTKKFVTPIGTDFTIEPIKYVIETPIKTDPNVNQ